ncbi:uncharacterized protein LOC112051917 [Bicyclus anynana]|uniref:Uncharacterized protein LOC112051917 n=1 Tax=Bicyclus anynana TaxID=110368 RepID=A0ABM3LP14_BICAN|nr:uncharacterized protein LOC112051917 [Bicyclus anynana]
MADVQCLLFAASDRSLTIYDVTTLTHTPVYCITGLPNIPMCLAYSPAHGGGESELAWGSERGDITRMRFLQPRLALLHTNTTDSINYYFWMELSSAPHSHYVSVTTWRGVHSRAVRRVSYARDGDIVWSCSHDGAVGVRSRHVLGKLEDYVFKVQRGVTCFHLVAALHTLATGGPDGVVRLWETQGSQFASLSAPGACAVLDVAIVAAAEVVVAYCSNCFVHIWDLYEECLLQTVKIKFPFLGVLGKKADFGTISIHPGPPRKKESEEEACGVPAGSRRGSSVYQGSTGGLMLQPEPEPASWDQRGLERDPCVYISTIYFCPSAFPTSEGCQSSLFDVTTSYKSMKPATRSKKDDVMRRFSKKFELLITHRSDVASRSASRVRVCCSSEYVRFDRSELLLSCCDCVCELPLRAAPGGVLPPPRDSLRARRPSFWELPADLIASPTVRPPKPPQPSPRLLAPVAAEESLQDLDELLEKAEIRALIKYSYLQFLIITGLQGLLEKDFVLMRGLKHDLNKKLHEMEGNKEAMRAAVSAGAPYLALKSYEPQPLPSLDRLAEQCARVVRLAVCGNYCVDSPLWNGKRRYQSMDVHGWTRVS